MREDIEGGGGGGSQIPQDVTRGYGRYVTPMQAFYGRAMQRGSPMVTAQSPGVTYKQDVPLGNRPSALPGLTASQLLNMAMSVTGDINRTQQQADDTGMTGSAAQRMNAARALANDIVASLAKKKTGDVDTELYLMNRDNAARNSLQPVPYITDQGGNAGNSALEIASRVAARTPPVNPYVVTPQTRGGFTTEEDRRRRRGAI